MKVETAAAFRYFMQDEIYLLNRDKSQGPDTLTAQIIIAEPIVETPAPALNYLGSNKKNFLILVHYPDHEFITGEHLTALQSILGRLEYAIDDVAIFNMAKSAVDHAGLLAHFTPEKLLLLGRDSVPHHFSSLSLNEPKQLENCATLYSFSFDEMMDSTTNKRIFWDKMKTL